MLQRFYCDHWPQAESCFNVETSRALTKEESAKLIGLIKPMRGEVRDVSRILQHRVVEIGPRISYATPASTNMVSVCRAIGLEAVTRIEESRRYIVTPNERERIIASHRDKMTQMIYDMPLDTFDSPHVPVLVQTIPALTQGISALQAFEAMHKLGIDPEYMQYYYQLVLKMRRDFTDVELFQLANANSDHSRHLFWRALLLIDGVAMPASLMEVVQRPWRNNPGNSLVAFRDNAGAIRGHRVRDMNWEFPGKPSRYVDIDITLHIIFTAESHNFPTYVSPYQGATTGPGGRIRDDNAFGRGARFSAGTTGYFTGNVHIPGYKIPGEVVGGDVNPRYTTPLKFLVEGSNGASDYANLIGEPFLVGFRRTFGQMVDGVRMEARKGVLFTGGLGFSDSRHVEKEEAQIGWLVIGLGGPAYPIGFGGGAASSGTAGTEEGDLNAVQRGDPKMENAVNRVIRSCVALGENNIIKVIHDQGAGGPANVLTELVEKLGAKLYLKNIVRGDKTMSSAQVWICEYQERYGILIEPQDLPTLQMFAAREGVNCEVVGEVTGDGQIVVYDTDTTTCVNLTLKDVLTDLPRQTRELKRVPRKLYPFEIPADLEIDAAFDLVSALPSVGSKADLVYQIDGSVGGRTVMGSCQGPLHLPVGDCGVVMSSFQSTTGAATAIGEQPIVGLIDAGAGARMSVSESLTNIIGGAVSSLENVNFQANWMCAVKIPGEGARLWDAVNAFADYAEAIGVRSTGGKDSSSMSTEVGGQLAVTPGQLVASSFSDVPNIERVVSQYFKSANSVIGYLDLGLGKMRMGGSALAQALNQLGDECPDIEPALFKAAFNAMHHLVATGKLRAVHDVSDGGLYTTLVEMCIAGNRGANIYLPEVHPIRFLFNQELGWAMEIPRGHLPAVREAMRPFGKHFHELGVTRAKAKVPFKNRTLSIMDGKLILSDALLGGLRYQWEATASQLQAQDTNIEQVRQERESHYIDCELPYRLTFTPPISMPSVLRRRYKVAIVRDEGSNGDAEMAGAFRHERFEAYDVCTADILNGSFSSFRDFRGAAFVGGFSRADVFGSARGWAAIVQHNERASELFTELHDRSDSFMLGVCNGNQLLTQLGWIPQRGITSIVPPYLAHNLSGRYEYRQVGVRIEGDSIFTAGMEGSVLPIFTAHGEGRYVFEPKTLEFVEREKLVAMRFVNPSRRPTEMYPFNPNGSPNGITAISSVNWRILGMMPHGERLFLKQQWPHWPKHWEHLSESPWLQLFRNAYNFCKQ